jgi:hypothetical protein
MVKFDESATAKWLRHTLPRFDVFEDVLKHKLRAYEPWNILYHGATLGFLSFF